MFRNRRLWIAVGAASAFLAVAFGAFAAHGLSAAPDREVMHTGSTYEFFHALAMLACEALVPTAPRARFAPPFFLAGTLLFSGSLYALALGAPRWIGVVTPFGGLSFLAGWAVVVWAALAAPPSDART
ncbi:MAG TPA: DUF423 domain-containing protein [Caulobacteraceae bacterium]|nr:DUF423 domain-containing protein [Caulobacteraceae bacterium]